MKQGTKELIVASAGLVFALLAVAIISPGPRREKPEPEVFIGQYGYVFSLSPRSAARLRITRAYKDPARVIELAFLFPFYMDPDAAKVTPDYSYGPLGAARLEAGSNALYPPMSRPELLDAMKEAVVYDLKERRVRHVITDVKGASLPGFQVETSGPQKGTTTYLVGARAHYIIVGDKDNPAVRDILATLRETP